jgi:hypothetical protein
MTTKKFVVEEDGQFFIARLTRNGVSGMTDFGEKVRGPPTTIL